MDLDAYLRRIGLPRDGLAADLATLTRIHEAHLQSIPFENLDVVLRKQIDMSPPAVFEKLVVQRRGGYCFEQNTLFAEGLRALGFNVKPVLARVRWNRAPSVETPFTHVVLIVALPEGEFMVDAGFGGLQCPSPLLLPPAAGPAPAANDSGFRITPAAAPGDYHFLQWHLRGEWLDMYKFRNEAALGCDLAVANWFMCTAPGARWTACLFAARMVGRTREHVINAELCVRDADGRATRTPLGGAAAVLAHLRDVFGIKLPASLCDDAEGGGRDPAALALVEEMLERGTRPEAFHHPSY